MDWFRQLVLFVSIHDRGQSSQSPVQQQDDMSPKTRKQALVDRSVCRIRGGVWAGAAFGPSERQRTGSTHVGTVEDRRAAQPKGAPDLPDRVAR
ncbi:hypothetical protein [Micromonospora ureilytica]|uniref:hypothetical protein n=1 Tax=Micromonospora ureilytica TaxID=709868 RepID=UPI004039DDDE